MNARIASACPLFPAPQPTATAQWYARALGFEIALAREDYAIVRREGAEIHLYPCADRHIAENTSAYLRVQGIDAVRASFPEALADGGRISPVATRDWGMREFYVWDPSGNLIRFGEPAADDQRAG
ncbi:VOC family protein [Salinarimonas sp.]|uniref:bleomycin resistance protein n=1 Tax=Salinarimonas sp. TaxID=2766526 RepID=UPI0032D8DFD9